MRCTSDGAFADALDAHLAVPALQRQLLRDTPMPPKIWMQRSTTRPAVSVAVDLGNRRVHLDVATAHVGDPGRLVGEQAGRAQFDLAVGDHPLDRLLVGQLCCGRSRAGVAHSMASSSAACAMPMVPAA
jgi:hypothetical protein